jgi:fibro-slime domain-containing protein
VFAGIVRDFRAYNGGQGHPDFETFLGDGMKGIVKDVLGDDHKPVYALPGPSQMTAGKEAFDQWYRDVTGVNIAVPVTLTPTVDASGLATYEDLEFFPIDGQGFGDEGLGNNFHFTFELHMTFVYKGGEVFSFTGDDDLWVFVNERLAIDLGGLHAAQSDVLDLDARAAELGIEVGKEYALDFFQAERHTTASKFKIQSTLAFTNCDPIVY